MLLLCAYDILPAGPPGTESCTWAVNRYSQDIGNACIRLRNECRVEPDVGGSSDEAEDCGGCVEAGAAWGVLIARSSIDIHQ